MTASPQPQRATTRTSPSLRIAVLMGGANTERNVSLSSGTAVVRALRGLGHAVAQVDSAASPVIPDQDPQDAFLTADIPEEDLAATPVAPSATAPPDLDALAVVRATQQHGVLAPGLLPILEHAEVVFITVFGDEGESGATQRLLDEYGIVYTGPSAQVCELTFDKAATKAVLAPHGILGPAGHVVRIGHEAADLAALEVPGPWIVKPVAGGSTIGLSLVDDADDLPEAVNLASSAGQHALVEEFVSGRDFTIGVLGERVFSVVEAMTDRDLYDYEAKYTPGEANKQVPADLSPEQTAELRALSGRVHQLLDIGDTSSRSDFRLGPDGRFRFFEVNPIPGLTPTSSYPLSAAADGIDFPQLCEELALRALASASLDDPPPSVTPA
jgi:D-alanine-D-alanine ligase